VASKWVDLGCSALAVWGSCLGSAKEPYRTQIDLSEPAFRCSCPSRKYPCKHALGLFLLLDSEPGSFSKGEPPPDLVEWIRARTERAQPLDQSKGKTRKEPDPGSRAKTAAKRLAKVEAGLAEIDLWMRDLVRGGLAGAQTRGYEFWDNAAARMVDAQAAGVARMIRQMGSITSSGEGWETRLLERLCRLHLLIEGFRRIDTLDPGVRLELRSLIGWTQSQEEVLSSEGTRDEWLVVGQRIEEEERFKVQRTWLQGRETGRRALILHFAAGNENLDLSLIAGTKVDAELVFFPGARQIRALVKARYSAALPLDSMPASDLSAECAGFADALSDNPWIGRYPFSAGAVIPTHFGEQWYLRDRKSRAVRLPSAYGGAWHLMALSGGRPIDVFGEWDGDALLPLSVQAEGRFVVLRF
jgi:hypothetical protein